jgi:hypothetical protein
MEYHQDFNPRLPPTFSFFGSDDTYLAYAMVSEVEPQKYRQ